MNQQFEGACLPAAWLSDIHKWAEDEPRIAAIWLFGSRATGKARDDSDLDLAVEVTESARDTALGWWICAGPKSNGPSLPNIPVGIDWQHIDREGDIVVWPSVQQDGILIYEREL
jgi:Polymerase beta, Nucleotidyltransferase